MNEPKCITTNQGQSASNSQLKCRVCILEIQDNHYVGLAFGLAATGITHFLAAGVTKEEALAKCMSWARQTIQDCVFFDEKAESTTTPPLATDALSP